MHKLPQNTATFHYLTLFFLWSKHPLPGYVAHHQNLSKTKKISLKKSPWICTTQGLKKQTKFFWKKSGIPTQTCQKTKVIPLNTPPPPRAAYITQTCQKQRQFLWTKIFLPPPPGYQLSPLSQRLIVLKHSSFHVKTQRKLCRFFGIFCSVSPPSLPDCL